MVGYRLRLLTGLGLFCSPLALADPIDFETQIFPIFENKCFNCHSDEKQKGDLRLDSPAWIQRGSENGDVLIPGDPDESTVYYLTTFDPDDPDYMPSKGKGLTVAEQELLRKWIEEGASYGDDAMMGMGGMMDGGMGGAAPLPRSSKYTEDVPLPPASYEVSDAVANLIAGMEKDGIRFDTVNHDAEYLEITYTYSEGGSDVFDYSRLESVAGSVVKLNFGRSPVTDADLEGVSLLANVTYVDLKRTKVTDAGVAYLEGLEKLEYLNLVGTEVTDESLEALEGLKGLKKVYVWGTFVTRQAAESFEKKVPGVEVVR
ncbi:MAG: c-type cytochrome domain-containing protein [Verrucomicrobiota bacterium]